MTNDNSAAMTANEILQNDGTPYFEEWEVRVHDTVGLNSGKKKFEKNKLLRPKVGIRVDEAKALNNGLDQADNKFCRIYLLSGQSNEFNADEINYSISELK